MKSKPILMLLLGITIGAVAGWVVQYQQKEQELRTLTVMHHLERVSFATNTLSQLPEDAGKADDLQLLVLESALTELERYSAGRLNISIPIPSLLEGLNRAESYARAHGHRDLAEKASVVSERLASAGA